MQILFNINSFSSLSNRGVKFKLNLGSGFADAETVCDFRSQRINCIKQVI